MARQCNLLSVDWDFFVFNGRGHKIPVAGFGEIDGEYLLSYMTSEAFSDDFDIALWSVRRMALERLGVDVDKYAGFTHECPLGCGPSPEEFITDVVSRSRGRCEKVIVVDSHAYGARFVKECRDEIGDTRLALDSFDAHHDMGYHPRDMISAIAGIAECSNWLLSCMCHRMINSLRIISPDGLGAEKTPPWFDCEIPKYGRWKEVGQKLEYDQILIVRSSRFSPPWLDNRFVEFADEVCRSVGVSAATKYSGLDEGDREGDGYANTDPRNYVDIPEKFRDTIADGVEAYIKAVSKHFHESSSKAS